MPAIVKQPHPTNICDLIGGLRLQSDRHMKGS
jgi:hypothetical protein